MARPREENSVSLFPFLAVLVCAMGALILLLLVTTRQIRETRAAQQHLQEVAPAAPVVPEATAEPETLPDVDLLRRKCEQLAAFVAESQSQLELLEEQAAFLQTQVDHRTAAVRDLRLEMDQEQLVADQERAGEDDVAIEDLQSEVRRMTEERDRLQAELTSAERELTQKFALLRRTEDAAQESESSLSRAISAVVLLRRNVEAAETSAELAAGGATLIEFTNTTGTACEAVVLDVADESLTLLPTGIKVTLKDLQGMPVKDNPLVAIILSAYQHRAQKSLVATEPYVLLLVRPSGCVAFYTAQRILTELGMPYGYELIEEDRSVSAGRRDDAEAQAVRDAVLELLARRERLYAGAGSPGARERSGSAGPTRGLVIRPDGRIEMQETDSDDLPGGLRPGDTLPGGTLPGDSPGRRAIARSDDFVPQVVLPPVSEIDSRGFGGGGGGGRGAPASDDIPALSEFPDGERPVPGEQSYSGEFSHGDPLPGHDDDVESADVSDALTDADPDAEPDAQGYRPIDDPTQRRRLPGTPEWMSSGNARIDALPADPNAGGTPLQKLDQELLRQLDARNRSSLRDLSTPVGITVFVDQQHVTVGQRRAVFVTEAGVDKAVAELFSGISEEVEGSRRHSLDPVLPIVKFVVSPGGEQLRVRLQQALKAAGVPCVSVVALEPYIVPKSGLATLPGNEKPPAAPPAEDVVRPQHRRRVISISQEKELP